MNTEEQPADTRGRATAAFEAMRAARRGPLDIYEQRVLEYELAELALAREIAQKGAA